MLVGKICSDQFWYNINAMRQTACLLVNPNTVNNFTDLLNNTPLGVSDLLMAQAKTLSEKLLGIDMSLVGPTGVQLLEF